MRTIVLELSFTNRTSLPASSKFVCGGNIVGEQKYSDDFVQINKTQIKGTCSCSPRFGDFSSNQRILDQIEKMVDRRKAKRQPDSQHGARELAA